MVEGFRGGGDRVTVWVVGMGQVTVWVVGVGQVTMWVWVC